MKKNRIEKQGSNWVWSCIGALFSPILICIVLILSSLICGLCNKACAQTSISLAWGWPVVMDGGKWDQISGTARLNFGYGWEMVESWKVGVMGGVRIPFNTPHFVPRAGVSAGYKLTRFFAFGAGLVYEFIPPYEDQQLHFVGLGLSPTILTKSGVGFSFVTGPGIAFGPGLSQPLWTWVIQPQLSFSF